MVLVTTSRKKHKSAPAKRRAATKVTQIPIVPNLPPIDDNASIEPGRSAASPKRPVVINRHLQAQPARRWASAGLPNDPEMLKQMLIDERIHRAVAEAKGVLLGKDGVPASNRDAIDLIDYLRVFGFRPPDLYGVLGIAKSTYLRLTRGRIRPVRDKYGWLKRKITVLVTETRDRGGSVVFIYGYRKIHRTLARESVQVSEKIVRRLMVELPSQPHPTEVKFVSFLQRGK